LSTHVIEIEVDKFTIVINEKSPELVKKSQEKMAEIEILWE